jgi:hypothetical protein
MQWNKIIKELTPAKLLKKFRIVYYTEVSVTFSIIPTVQLVSPLRKINAFPNNIMQVEFQ